MTTGLRNSMRQIPVMCAFAVLLSIVPACGTSEPVYSLFVDFTDDSEMGDWIAIGAAVSYKGVEIGEVEDVFLVQDDPTREARLRATVRIDDPVVRLREDDQFVIRRAGLLGDTYIDVVPATAESAPLPPDAVVEGSRPDPIGDGLEAIADSLESLIGVGEEEEEDTTGSNAYDDRDPE
jgi:ABC-type transporter Mla subunit MlaD